MSQNLQENSGLTLALNSIALAIGSTTSQFSAALVNYAINGRIYQKAAAATQALVIEPNTGIVPTAPNTLQTLAAGQACAFLVLLDASGNYTVVQGALVEAGKACPVPAVPANRVPVGVIKVSNVTNPFIPGTTAFSAAGVTTTYINVLSHPGASV